VKTFIAALRAALVAAAFTAFAACDMSTAPTAGNFDGSAASLTSSSTGKKITCPGKSGGVCDMYVSVLMEEDGDATLIVRTGGYDEATGDHDPNGTFEKVQYKIYDTKGKLVATKNDNASGTVFRVRLPGTFKKGYRVEVQANIKNHSGKKGTSVVRGTGDARYLPDIDLTAETIELLVNGQRQPLTSVLPGVPNTYIVDIANLTTFDGSPSTTGLKVMCVVTVDGRPQIPVLTPGFSYVDGALQYIGPGETGSCSFNLKLSAGEHTIKVTAVAADLFADSHPHNNSTTAQVVAESAPQLPADLSVTRLERVAGGTAIPAPALGEITVGSTETFKIWVTSPTNASAATANCSATVNGAAPTGIVWVTQSVTIAGGATGECVFTLPFATPGPHVIEVVAASAGDPNTANNSAAGTLQVKPAVPADVTTDLVVLEAGPSIVITSGTEQQYVAKIGVNAGGSLVTPAFTCTVAATRASGEPAAVTVTWLKQTGSFTASGDDECRFRVAGMTSNGGQDDVYRLVVTATATNAVELPGKLADNSRTIEQTVRAIAVDLEVIGIERSSGSAWTTVDSVLAGPTFTYRVAVGTIEGPVLTSSNFTCTAEATSPGAPTLNVAGIVSGPATLSGAATCSFPLALQGNGNNDRDYQIRVTVTPQGANEAAQANNIGVFTQKAMVRADVGVVVDRITLSVDGSAHPCTAVSGLCSVLKTDTISVGKTGNYTAFLHNYSSDRTASVICEVWTAPPGGVPTQVTAVPPMANIGPGGEVSCAFSHAFTERVAAQFTVIAKTTSPKDNQNANDTVRFTMAPVQNIVFPNLQFASVTLHEYGNQPGGVVSDVYQQQANISRVFLAFTNRTEVIGDFTFSGKALSNGSATPFSEAVFEVRGLRPGGTGTQRNCVTLGGPGATLLSQSTRNLQYVLPEICAEQSPSDATVQMISVTYNTLMDGTYSGPDIFTYGPTVTFELKLEWVLAGNLPSQVSTARGKLQFDVATRPSNTDATYVKNQIGTVTILPP
jgi:hypothetical protein